MTPPERDPSEGLGSVAATDLVDPRTELHHAAQLLASFGAAHVDARADDSHRNLGWDANARAFTSHTGSRNGLHVQLRPHDLELSVVGRGGTPVSAQALAGTTLTDARGWLADTIARASGEAAIALVAPEFELPKHPTVDGAAMRGEPKDAFAELERWYALAAATLADVVAGEPGASPVRCWPHHFDLATLITVKPDPNPEKARTVGVGMTPGDGGYPEPYWYVTPWPYPKNPPLPPLGGGGVWHTEGWFGAVLTGSALVGNGSGQGERLDAFLRSALSAAHALHAEI